MTRSLFKPAIFNHPSRIKRFVVLIIMSITHPDLMGYTFEEAVNSIKSHESVQSLKQKSLSIESQASQQSSWGDPMLKVAAKNFRAEHFAPDATPMTGIEVTISQRLPLTTKYSHVEAAHENLAAASHLKAEDQRVRLIHELWIAAISAQEISEEISLIEENIAWLEKTIKISKKLYTTGRLSQQAILGFQIRKAEQESQLLAKKAELEQVKSQLNYLVPLPGGALDVQSVPWEVLNKQEQENKDNLELALEKTAMSKRYQASAAKLDYIPDITVSLGYTQRDFEDDWGDFISAAISMPIPVSSQKYATRSSSLKQLSEAELTLKAYQKQKQNLITRTTLEVKKIADELRILSDKSINYSQDSRDITAKSYGLGKANYIELLQAELNLQKQLLRQIRLKASKRQHQIRLRYLKGLPLYVQK